MTAASEAANPLVAGLARPEAYGAGVSAVRMVETHISWVFLTGEHAYKVKKPVKLPFLDFSTLERRRHFCELEVEINRRIAPKLYLGVVPIGGEPAAPRVGQEPAIEYAVKMREFPADARLDRRLAADAVPREALVAFAERLAGFHADLPPVDALPRDPAEAAVAAALENFDELEPQDEDERGRLQALRAWTEREGERLAPTFRARFAAGCYREGHGDLHLENLVVLDADIAAFDALEFDVELRRIDVMSEAGFLMMDLMAHARDDLAYAFLNRYLEVGGDYEGLAVLPFYLIYRALVRAKVRRIKAAQAGAERPTADAPYIELAARLAAPRRPRLVLMHGLSGSGKTHLSSELVCALPAVRVRSDIERKRLQGLDETARTGSAVGAGLYAADATERTYGRLADVTRVALRAGLDCIADATFLHRADRDHFRRLAADEGATFAIVDCAANERVLRERITARAATSRDASEANLAVLDHQLATHDPLGADELPFTLTVDTEQPLDPAGLAAALRRGANDRA
ncbi:MAG TPA: AAA family ATPase [Gammaproteobacteria bacterium]